MPPNQTSSNSNCDDPQSHYDDGQLPLNPRHLPCLFTLMVHRNSYVSCFALTGKFLYIGSSDREIRLWKRNPSGYSARDGLDTKYNVVAVEGKGAVKAVVVSGDKLFGAYQDHKIRVWRINNYQEPDVDDHDRDRHQQCHKLYTRLATLPTLRDRASKILLPKNQVQVRRHKTCTWVHHVDAVSALALSKDESLLYSVSWDRTLKIWRTSDFKCLESITRAHEDAINAITVLNDGDVYTGSADGKIKVWRKKTGEKNHSLISTLQKHNSGINALASNIEGSVLYSGASDGSILVWEKNNGECVGNMVVVGELGGHTQPVLCLFIVSDLVCSGSADKTIRIWRGFDRNYFCLAVLEGHKGPVKCLAAAVDRKNVSNMSVLVYSGGLDGDVKLWEVNVPTLYGAFC